MVKKVGAVSIGVIIGLVVAFARAGAFQLWGSDQPQSQSSPAGRIRASRNSPRRCSCPRPHPPISPSPTKRPASSRHSHHWLSG